MNFYLICLAVLVGGGVLSLLCASREKVSSAIGIGSTGIASLFGILAALQALTSPQVLVWKVEWSLPMGSLFLKIDALAAFFLMIIFVISFLCAVYNYGYLQPYAANRNLGVPRLFMNLLIAGMALVVTAANGILFIIAWEIMSFAAYFLVVFEDKNEQVQGAGFTYLIATHIGTAFLFFMFWLLATYSGGSMDFEDFAKIQTALPEISGIIFILTFIGFGAKAGFVPFHVWLPEAHPAAPSPVSALMSGVMIKTGIYGILRILTFLGHPPAWFATTLIITGLISGVFAVLHAIAQHDLKRLLAYSSVENIGIILLGLGIGLLGITYHVSSMAVLGFAGGLLHILNHAIFKSLLFMGAGAVQHQTHTRNLDQLGGLFKKMPVTGTTFFTGAAAISGLPLFNGFTSEFLIYLASFSGLVHLAKVNTPLPLTVILGLTLIGGLALVCFTKAFGVIFLGKPRFLSDLHLKECNWQMRLSMILLAGLCVLIGLFPFLVLPLLKPLIPIVSGLPAAMVDQELLFAFHSLFKVFQIVIVLLVLFSGLFFSSTHLIVQKKDSDRWYMGLWLCCHESKDTVHRLFICATCDRFDQMDIRLQKRYTESGLVFSCQSHFFI